MPILTTCRRNGRRFIVRLVLLAAGLPAAASPTYGQTLNLTGGPLTLTVNAAVPGSGLTPVTDSSTQINWEGALAWVTKITIRTDCPGQAFALYALAQINSGGGEAKPEVSLSDGITQDLIRGIPSTGSGGSLGSATIRYRVAPEVTDGNRNEHGDDVHLITYTIMAQ